MDENYVNIVEDGEGSDAGSDTKNLLSEKKPSLGSEETEVVDSENATTSTPNPTGTPLKTEKEEEGEQDSEQDDPTGLNRYLYLNISVDKIYKTLCKVPNSSSLD